MNNLIENDIRLGIVTDGRTITQKNKIKALNLNRLISDDCIIISQEFGSQKPDLKNFRYFSNKFGEGDYFYVGDNTTKDFIAPNYLGWYTICLLGNEQNIHSQDFSLSRNQMPHKIIKSFTELSKIVFNE